MTQTLTQTYTRAHELAYTHTLTSPNQTVCTGLPSVLSIWLRFLPERVPGGKVLKLFVENESHSETYISPW